MVVTVIATVIRLRQASPPPLSLSTASGRSQAGPDRIKEVLPDSQTKLRVEGMSGAGL